MFNLRHKGYFIISPDEGFSKIHYVVSSDHTADYSTLNS